MPIVVKRGKTDKTKDDLIGKFRRLCMEEGIVDEVKERVSYVKASAKRYAEKKLKKWKKELGRRQRNRR